VLVYYYNRYIDKHRKILLLMTQIRDWGILDLFKLC